MTPPALPSRLMLSTLLLIAFSGSAWGARVVVQMDGIDDELSEAALAAMELSQYAERDVSRSQVRRLYNRAKAQIAGALEPYGYYNAKVDGELRKDGDNFTAVLHVDKGPPTLVEELSISISGISEDLKPVDKARAAFLPKQGQRLDHAAYERSKAAIANALTNVGYINADPVAHRIEVTRATNSAKIVLDWEAGLRYRFGETRFEGSQFPDSFTQPYVPWDVGEFYDNDELLALQQRLSEANYFSLVQVRPELDDATDGQIPIEVILAPAKRTVYTGGVFVGTDTGAGVRAGIERRWINDRGHKLEFDTILAQRLKTLGALYRIPFPGRDQHSLNFGLSYRDEVTDTSESQIFRAAISDSSIWHGWTRTIGLQFLTGDFTVADQPGNTTMLYPEVSLSKKHADNVTFPRSAWSLTVAARASQDGILADTSFGQITADAKWIRGIGENSRFIARASAGYSTVGDFDKLPPELRFFAGGDRSIRGYPYQSIGPRELVPGNTEPQVIGGESLFVASAEYEYYFTEKWGGAVFVDFGDAFTGTDFNMNIGAGLGLRWRSPVGLVRADLGTPVNNEYQDGVQLHIIIGPDL
ncbi:autotransporter assembly complex protein TamA [Dokdonella sp.]|uniref:autotransporter assembly complex protein TamA n=1 Tax=Dokdonella sp. TaxID=2291710 RepID=UPI003C4A9861